MTFKIGDMVNRIGNPIPVGEIKAISLLGDFFLVRWLDGTETWLTDFDLEEDMTEFKSNTDFRIGDKVRCIKENNSGFVVGEVYTVAEYDDAFGINKESGHQKLIAIDGCGRGGHYANWFEIVLEDTPMTETEKAVYHLQSLLHINNATIVITAEGIEVLRAEQDESYNPEVWSLDGLLKALDVIEHYNN